MQLGIVGLGRMGANMARRLVRGGHACVVYNRSSGPVDELVKDGAQGTTDLAKFVSLLAAPRAIWLMVPAAVVDRVLADLMPHLAKGDIVIDGGNSYYRDDIERARRLLEQGIHYVDCGTSGGVWGLDRGYCLMIGGEAETVKRLDPIFATLAPGVGSIPPTAGRAAGVGTAERGYLHCGPHGAGHFVKMVHNGIEYGLMAAYAEGLNILKHANVGKHGREADAETTPLRHPEHYQYDLNVADIAEVFGDTRQIVVCRELTKKFETIQRLALADAVAWLEADTNQQRGEFVLVLSKPNQDGAIEAKEAQTAMLERTLRILLGELPLKQAVAIAVELTELKKNAVYDTALKIRDGVADESDSGDSRPPLL